MPTGTGDYASVDIPFVGGQDESYDRKILPVGPLRRVNNAFQQRTGRWTERYGEDGRELLTLENVNVSGHVAKSTLPEDRLSLLYRGNGRVSYWGNTLTDDEFVRVVSGEHGGFGYLGQWFASGYPSSKTDWMTFSPSVTCTDRHIIFAFISTSRVVDTPAQPFHVNVIWYDINTLRIVRVDSWQPASSIALECKVAADSLGSLYLVLNSRTTNGSISIFQWGSPTSGRITRLVFPSRGYSTFDLAPATNGIWLCYCTDANVVTLMRYMNNAALTTVTQTLTTAPDSSTRTVYCSVAASGNDNAVGIGATNGLTGQQARLRVFNGTPMNTYHTGIYGDSAYYPAYLPTGDVTLFWANAPGTSNVNLQAGSTAFDGSPVLVDNNSFVVGHPIVSRDAVGNGFDARGHVPLVGFGAYKAIVTDLTAPATPLVTPGDTAGYARVQSSIEVLLRPKNDGANVPISVGGIVARAGAIMLERVATVLPSSYNALQGVPKTTAARPVECGDKYWVVPCEQNLFPTGAKDSFQTVASFVLLDNERTIGALSGEAWDRNNVLMSGCGMHAVDDQALFFAGFSGRPSIVLTQVATPPVGAPGIWQYLTVAEYRDAAGRLWRSAPSLSVTGSSDSNTRSTLSLRPPPGYPMGTRMVLYRTEAAGSLFYQHSSYPVDSGLGVDTTVDADIVKGEPVYTAGGVLENAAPPAARFVVRTRDRVWAGLLDYTARVQSSKFIRPTEGVHWSNADQFFVDIPQAVTGLATMDDVLVVFCENNIYLVHGEGPSDLGVGAYSPPQRIPSDVGCVQARSIVSDANGIYFMSRRGIEIMSRGFSAPVFIGDAVRDLVQGHPYCLDAQNYQTDKNVRWLLSDRGGLDQESASHVILVFDTRTGAWSTYETDPLIGIGVATGNGPDSASANYPPDGMSLYYFSLDDMVPTREVLGQDEPRWQIAFETGEIRPVGMLAGALGRRLNVLGTYHGPAEVTLQMAFDDARDWHPTWVKTWTLDASGYQDGDAVTLEMTLPQQKFQAARFRLSAVRTTDAHPGFDAHGITVYFDTEGAGPRRTIGRAQKG